MLEKRKVGFYLHTSWEFAYPFAVRSWTRADFAGWCKLMRQLEMNLLMLWPLSEAMPAPLSPHDRAALHDWRDIVSDAKGAGLECWLTFAPNVTSEPQIADKPFKQRHLYPFRIDVKLDDIAARNAYLAHRAEIMGVLDNGDAYVTIDGDPGSYPGARPEDFVAIFKADRLALDRIGRRDAQLVPWLWAGWGHDWETNGPWNEPIAPLNAPVIEQFARELAPPWTLLPGRSIRDDWANGRANFALVEEAGLVEQSVLLCYEIIEYEPTPPAVNLQFDDIRRVLRQEKPLIEKARGIMGNAQQPIMALPNIFLFARGARDWSYLDKSDGEVLRDLAAFLGGPADALVAAWRSGHAALEEISADLPRQLRAATLRGEAAKFLPGGAPRYLDILAAWVEARLGVLRACAQPVSATRASEALAAIIAWWKVHRYVFSGEQGDGFRLDWTHHLLLAPLRAWSASFTGDRAALRRETIALLQVQNLLPAAQIEDAVNNLFQ